MDLKKFNPKNLPTASVEDLQSLTIEDIKELASLYPYMNGDLLIKRANGSGVASPATYKSLYFLLKSGHKFVIIDVRNRKSVPTDPIIHLTVEEIEEVESDFFYNEDYIEPEQKLLKKTKSK